MPVPSVLVFDVNETLVDIESLAPLFTELFGDERVLREWFAQLVMYSMSATLADSYVDFSTLAQGVFRMVGDIHGVAVSDDDAHRLKNGLLTMPAHPDAAEGLTMLKDNGFRLVTLTNSPPNPDGPTALQSSGLAEFFEHQLSVDACRAFKPSPTVYRYACETLGVAPADCMMVAAHVWDTLGAQSVGFGGALIARPGNPPLPVDGLPQPDLVAGDLRQLAAQLIDH
ncbi:MULTISPECIES: haloacid dehalogenase type II [unclassified Mycobacterium]|uniref:haloacid dehalogenase type II n=1 Tax=unclassified Mycobacterium TaxID=2642494 RepID=UPI00080087C4|nr:MULTISPECIES: haloacid dehalogenase type II [unclassified Mycobacterium]OBG50437.1 haloacid dehalogenase, type II [Mycobacterium sp. E735]OBG60930.1 haloacid dehalogenase, type II [Mycobacterium sp. E188]OBG77736.1 haloacid dehalogenase, type II [Mycobacterium sp. E3305]OBG92978.1 haloacid dehalogenase, type II [Mycobacterium sp. E3298]OBH17450.1 haloacid dehalogenase, type II [Mycobacterium sp. E1715]